MSEKETQDFEHERKARETEEMLRNMADDIEVPPSLEPEAVEKMLSEKKRQKDRKYRWKYAGIAAAACLCIVAGAALVQKTGNNPDLSDKAGTTAESQKQNQTVITSAKDYDEIYKCIQKNQDQMKQARTLESAADGASKESSTAQYAGGTDSASPENYSDTNVREAGVDEADRVKTDGKNLYIQTGNNVKIVDITSDDMKELADITLEEDASVREIYLAQEKLLVLYSKMEYDDGKTGYDGSYKEYACVDIYDISDPSSPQKTDTFSQSGSYYTMRAKDGYVYIISNFYVDAAAPRDNISLYVPEVRGKTLEASDIYMPQQNMGSQYTVISAVSINDSKGKTDSKAVFGSAGICYVSNENIYVTEEYYGTNGETTAQTSIRKVSYKEGKLEGTAQTKVDGTLRDSFSIDEYNGYLRVLTTVVPADKNNGISLFSGMRTEKVQTETPKSSSVLYILDSNLEQTGAIENIAPGEQVYSARFMGDTGYFVTFRQVDPLFSADLSDPSDPKIIGQLKIPGFSDYLHPYGDGLLLGVGMDVDEEGVTTEGVKLSMFDISNPSDVTQISSYVLENTYGTEISYEYRAAFVDVEKNLIGFTVYGDRTEYDIFSYDPAEGFKEVFSRQMDPYSGNARGLYAGEKFYLINGNTVESFSLSSFDKIDDIVL